jgi:hypothetical protein
MQVEGPTGIIISIAAWMFDPVACARMVVGAPCVDLATLLALKQVLLIGAGPPRDPPNDKGFARGKAMKLRELPTAIAGRQMSLLFDSNRLDGLGALERSKAAAALARILMQAAGVRVEELDDDKL